MVTNDSGCLKLHLKMNCVRYETQASLDYHCQQILHNQRRKSSTNEPSQQQQQRTPSWILMERQHIDCASCSPFSCFISAVNLLSCSLSLSTPTNPQRTINIHTISHWVRQVLPCECSSLPQESLKVSTQQSEIQEHCRR